MSKEAEEARYLEEAGWSSTVAADVSQVAAWQHSPATCRCGQTLWPHEAVGPGGHVHGYLFYCARNREDRNYLPPPSTQRGYLLRSADGAVLVYVKQPRHDVVERRWSPGLGDKPDRMLERRHAGACMGRWQHALLPRETEPLNNLDVLQLRVAEWLAQTFPGATPQTTLEELRGAMEDLAAVQKDGDYSFPHGTTNQDEAANCLLALLKYAACCRFSLADVTEGQFQLLQQLTSAGYFSRLSGEGNQT